MNSFFNIHAATIPNCKTQEILLTKKDVAQLLQLSVRTITRMRAASLLPMPLEIGGSLRWRRGDIDAWLNDRCEASSPVSVSVGLKPTGDASS